VYPTDSLVTASSLWTEICAVVCSGKSETGLLKPDGHGWTIDGEVSGEVADMAALYLPLLVDPPADRPFVVAHLAQSLDGCIARLDGESHWITGDEDLDHTHRLRAICDAVLVGAHTVDHDDCQLTVRRCEGTQPLRVVVDPAGRVPTDRCVFNDGKGCTLWIHAEDSTVPEVDSGVDVIALPRTDGQIAPSDVLAALRDRGIRRLFVEGGGVTVSHFLKAGCLDRLHLAVAPLLIGDGRSTLSTVLGEQLSDCPRPRVQVIPLGPDWLFDCAFDGADG